jgi:hypothetical protein
MNEKAGNNEMKERGGKTKKRKNNKENTITDIQKTKGFVPHLQHILPLNSSNFSKKWNFIFLFSLKKTRRNNPSKRKEISNVKYKTN